MKVCTLEGASPRARTSALPTMTPSAPHDFSSLACREHKPGHPSPTTMMGVFIWLTCRGQTEAQCCRQPTATMVP